jgi:uncharacterized Zn finger protein (UPF0148 family)
MLVGSLPVGSEDVDPGDEIEAAVARLRGKSMISADTHCPSCGVEVQQGDAFCTQCGVSLTVAKADR